jgi:hypothetical protein
VSSSATRIDGSEQVARRRDVLPQVHPEPSHQVGDVSLPLAQVRVGDLVEHQAEVVEDLLDGPLGVHALVAHQRLGARYEHRIIEHQDLRVEQRCEFGAASARHARADVAQLLP